MSDVELLPTVVLEHARTGQPIVVDKRDYLARKDGRYANWRLLGHGDFISPPPLPSESEEEDGLAATLARPSELRKPERTAPDRRRRGRP